MAELFEATMLICFGFSWPMSVVKNYKAKTAKGMSLGFIVLIITGYVAGITAKVIAGRINYVFAVYIFNLVMVSANLVIYFYNRHLDKMGENKMVTITYKENCYEQVV